MHKLIYMGNYVPQLFEAIMRFKNIRLLGIIIDESADKRTIKYSREIARLHQLNEYKMENIPHISPDMIFLCNYTKLLKTELLNQYLFVNIHAGILPKWRGFNANCWAMLNGEKKVGYTIHRVRDGMDNGEIYHIEDICLADNESYQSARDRIRDKLCKKLENVFEGIILGTLKGKKQEEQGIVYNCKLKREDGDIRDWDKTTDYLLNLYRVFSLRYGGTGVRMYVKEKQYEILQIERAVEIASSVGIPGAVVNKYSDGSVLIKTRDTAVKLGEIQTEEGIIIKSGDILKIGMRLL